jgi:uncharacterized protein (TIGR03083 family)
MSELSTADVLTLLRDSHERLRGAFDELGDARATLPSYDDEWSVAQVASHLGSGTEIFSHHLNAAAKGEPLPGGEINQPIWDAWNAKSPTDQIRDSLAANASFLETVEAMTDEERDRWHAEIFGTDLDLNAFLRMRLGEHVVHTWDVTVALDPNSTLSDEAAAAVAEGLGALAGRVGRAPGEQASVEVRTTSPERAFHLDLSLSGVSLSPSLDDTSSASLTLPTEAFVRLVYGRLDADHTPASTSADGIDLDLLRTVFPGV